MITITKEFNFSAAHYLPNHKGACHNPHGHNYKLFVEVEYKYAEYNLGKTLPQYGMVVDFNNLKNIVNEKIISIYDHKNLNEFFSNPTAEMMIEEIASILNSVLSNVECNLISLKLYETETSFVTWRRGA